ncbi:MAG TPA: hypothetical protein VMI54_14180 [Polyangiaceae bacterium]|nr:hypothetical protein [Polyangiaceae bacterium]
MSSRAFIPLVSLVACAPVLPDDGGVVTAPRVLAVKAEPAESKPNTAVTYTALVAAPAGSEVDPALSWDFCTAPKPPTEDNAVSAACLGDGALVPAGEGPEIDATTPREACSLFGPDTPPGGFRPRDPDLTGGYYEPLRVDLAGAAPSFALDRLRCDLGGAPADVATAFANEYVPNDNPVLLPLSATLGGQATSLASVPASAAVALVASWPPESAETYAYFDRSTELIVTRRESMRVGWYVTAGRLAETATGVGEDDESSTTTNTWTAPATPGPNVLWLVLQDSRGGVDFARYDVTVTP